MSWRSLGAAAVLAVILGLAGFSVTGCQNLTVGPQIQNPDSASNPNLDDPEAPSPNPGPSVVPIEASGSALEEVPAR